MAARDLLSGLVPGPPVTSMVAVVGAGCADLIGLGDGFVDLRRPASPWSAFSAPTPADPIVPDRSDVVVVTVDAAAIGRVIADRCDRAMRVAALAGCSPYERLTVDRAAAALCSGRGYLGRVPPGASALLVVTGADHLAATGLVDACAGDYSGAVLLEVT